MKKILFVFLILVLIPCFGAHAQASGIDNWRNFGGSVNDSFFFVLEKIISIQSFFIKEAYNVGRVALLIALLSAGLNYALTGSGFKENMIKIMKASIFFFIVTAAYPLIIGWITTYAYELAYNSVGGSVEKHYSQKLQIMSKDILEYKNSEVRSDGNGVFSVNGTYTTDTFNIVNTLTMDYYTADPELQNIFSKIKKTGSVTVNGTPLDYTAFAPAAVVELLLVTAKHSFDFADNANIKVSKFNFPDFAAILKGLICGFFLLFTGFFALIEYLVCMLEFMLVASVGIILLPLSIWEGSKFLSEKFIGAIVGFFMKLLFCNIAVFLLLYGYVSMFKIIGLQKFMGSIDQIAFILFSCLLFFFICKSAPAVAQSLLTGTPSLNAAGAIGAVAGAVGAAAATAGLAGKAGGFAAKTAGAVAGGGARAVGGAVGSLTEANAAKTAAITDVAAAGGTIRQQQQAGRGAFFGSLAGDVGDSLKTGALGLVRSVSGGKDGGSSGGGGSNPHSWRDSFNNTTVDEGGGKIRKQTLKEHLDDRKTEGTERGNASAAGYKAKHGL